jgi:hypothetical protein
MIAAGESLARKIKNAVYPDEEWTPKLAFKIGYRMQDIKKVARPYYPDSDEVAFVRALGDWSEKDIRDALEMNVSDKEVTCRENQPNAIGGHMQRSMAKERNS